MKNNRKIKEKNIKKLKHFLHHRRLPPTIFNDNLVNYGILNNFGRAEFRRCQRWSYRTHSAHRCIAGSYCSYYGQRAWACARVRARLYDIWTLSSRLLCYINFRWQSANRRQQTLAPCFLGHIGSRLNREERNLVVSAKSRARQNHVVAAGYRRHNRRTI